MADDTTRKKIVALRKSGMSERTIADRLGMSRSAVHRALAAKPPKSTPVQASEPVSDEELQAAQRRAFAEVSQLAAAARQAGDAAASSAWQRVLNGISHEIRQHKPDSRDPDDFHGIPGEQIREAAESGRRKLLDALERAKAERETWPKCAQCGQPVRPT